jgi:hypothetical protein
VQLFGAQYGYSIKANQYYNITINNEYEKLKFGEASLIDVLRIKDLLIQAELSAMSIGISNHLFPVFQKYHA